MSKTWKIDPEGVLTILPGFRKTKGQPDIYALRDEIKSIVVEEGVHEIGDDWFCYLHEVREISFPSTLRRIGKSLFLGVRNWLRSFFLKVSRNLPRAPFKIARTYGGSTCQHPCDASGFWPFMWVMAGCCLSRWEKETNTSPRNIAF